MQFSTWVMRLVLGSATGSFWNSATVGGILQLWLVGGIAQGSGRDPLLPQCLTDTSVTCAKEKLFLHLSCSMMCFSVGDYCDNPNAKDRATAPRIYVTFMMLDTYMMIIYRHTREKSNHRVQLANKSREISAASSKWNTFTCCVVGSPFKLYS